MSQGHILVQQASPLTGTIELVGAKNAVLVIIASTILTKGKSTLKNVPDSADVRHMIMLLEDLGALVTFDSHAKELHIDSSTINNFEVRPERMAKMRASILVMGPLLARFRKAKVALPGGCLIGARPINYHLQGFHAMGVITEENEPFLNATFNDTSSKTTSSLRIILEYPSVGATENLMMLAALRQGETTIVNAALEPEVLDLISVLTKMGAKIHCHNGLIITIQGVNVLNPINHTVIPDRLEAGALLLSAGITGGYIHLPNARADHMDLFLEKLKEMGHEILTGTNPSREFPYQGITLKATAHPKAISFKTGAYPGFPTDLQAPTMAALCLADGTSHIEETVFENRLIHTKELQKMGAQITVNGPKATIRGVEELYGCRVIATDIRASCALVLAGLASLGTTHIIGIHHWQRGYDKLEHKLAILGAHISIFEHESPLVEQSSNQTLTEEHLPTTQKPL